MSRREEDAGPRWAGGSSEHRLRTGVPRWIVPDADAGVRLDRFLAAARRLGSRSRAAGAIARRKVFVNDVEAAKTDGAMRLGAGDVVGVWMDRPGTARQPFSGRRGDLDILHEDDDLIAVNKPAGILTVPLERREDAPSVYEQLQQHLRSRGKHKPLVVHRIDRDTSGVVVFAKNAAAQQSLRRQFVRRQPERVYLAVVYGEPSPPSGTWRNRLLWDKKALVQKETHPRDPGGKDAEASYRLIESFGSASLIEVRLKTGKRNQIRLQARLRGHTLVGEARYVFGPESLRPIRFPRQALHANRLTLVHPRTGRRFEIEAPVPDDIAALIEGLRRRTGRR
jgi:23S rRNA pseudouridine1911/1915/1917 synthase